MTLPLFRGLAILAAILATSLIASTPASADFPFVGQAYDTVDAIQSDADFITVTGIVVGQSAATTSSFRIGATSTSDGVARCDRFALLAMAKPGKYRFATVGPSGLGDSFVCKLTVRTP